eukprot:6192413-Pleurochrysis_carterae.AAC.3
MHALSPQVRGGFVPDGAHTHRLTWCFSARLRADVKLWHDRAVRRDAVHPSASSRRPHPP